MGHWWVRNIIEPGKLPLLLALASFVLTFLVTRVITRLIRAGKGPFRNITPGGIHVHHVVPGVILMVIGGFIGMAGGPRGFGSAVAAVLFGIGVGLVLDEFALILHLDDVYWTEAGTKSVEIVIITAALVALILCGFLPFGVNELSPDETHDRFLVVRTVGINFLCALIALFKGKGRMAVIGVVIPFVALVGAIRLARPNSPWARRFYARRPRAQARAKVRAYRHDVRWSGIRRRIEHLIGGAPSR
ncbi:MULTISPECIES: hypothetical protein [Streptomyces]|uniref:Integral membrane protein n=1 Tax=Streptomyces kasugaensis TaxID=1946 RepID=A0A4Q9I054_STRKA|nr:MULTISPECIES: hypothetical protein [Streptomyces]MYU52911.1 hypothetical protein [Streptomyces sp. SID7805]TBO60269.1 hypothetical protein EYS09_07670 [Streptomyces kasugaensis]WSK11963.1 hypothetical protein OG717_09340 [Streptomyces celluloflavus]